MTAVRRPSAGIDRQTVVLPPGASRAIDERCWRGTLIVVRRGQVELVSLHGLSHAFGAGSLLWFDGLALAGVHNPGHTPAVLTAIRCGKDTPRASPLRSARLFPRVSGVRRGPG